MKHFLIVLSLFASLSLVGCAASIHAGGATTKTDTEKSQKTHQVQKAQHQGTYLGTGVGVGFVSF